MSNARGNYTHADIGPQDFEIRTLLKLRNIASRASNLGRRQVELVTREHADAFIKNFL
jgi:hypothetical protein